MSIPETDLSPPGPLVPGWQQTVSLFGGILLWMAHLIGLSALVGYGCDSGNLWVLHVFTAGHVAATLAVLGLSVRIHRRREQTAHVEASRFLGWVGIGLNVASLVLIVGEHVPVFLLDACTGF